MYCIKKISPFSMENGRGETEKTANLNKQETNVEDKKKIS